jgi:hypothetical protein
MDEQDSGSRRGVEIPESAVGARVVDASGEALGHVRALYPHYLAVERGGAHPEAYRVPYRAVAGFDGTTVSLAIGREVLDPMTPSGELLDPPGTDDES